MTQIFVGLKERFLQDEKGNYKDRDPLFRKCIDVLPSINQIVRYRNFLQNIDWDSMKYLVEECRINNYFNEGEYILE